MQQGQKKIYVLGKCLKCKEKQKFSGKKKKKKCEGKKAPLWNDTDAFRTSNTAFVQIQALFFFFFFNGSGCVLLSLQVVFSKIFGIWGMGMSGVFLFLFFPPDSSVSSCVTAVLKVRREEYE